jgi:hypothetical protein
VCLVCVCVCVLGGNAPKSVSVLGKALCRSESAGCVANSELERDRVSECVREIGKEGGEERERERERERKREKECARPRARARAIIRICSCICVFSSSLFKSQRAVVAE